MFFTMNRAEAYYNATKDSSTGKFAITDNDTGKVIAKVKVKADRINGIYVNSKAIYFTAGVNYFAPSYGNSFKSSLYKYDRETKKVKYLKYLGDKYWSYSVGYVYGGSVYITGNQMRIGQGGSNDDSAGFRYYLSSGKLQKIIEHEDIAGGYKNYVLCYITNFNMPWPFDVNVYNTKTKKTTTPVKKTVTCQRVDQYLYVAKPAIPTGSYYQPGYPNYTSYKHTVSRYDLLTGKTKKLASGLKANYIGKISAKYIYYKLNDKSYRYTISTKKSKQISSDEYKGS